MTDKKFEKTLKTHKIISGLLWRKKDIKYLMPYKVSGRLLIILYSNGECFVCQSKENLQIHHLFSKKNREYMDLWRYYVQRNYWANLTVLCRKCHAEAEKREINDDSFCLSEKKTNK